MTDVDENCQHMIFTALSLYDYMPRKEYDK